MGWTDLIAVLKRPLPLLGVLGACLGTLLIGGAIATDKSVFGPTTAAWVQAVGTIAAIIAAVAIPIAERRGQVAHYREAALAVAKELVDEIVSASGVIRSLAETKTYDHGHRLDSSLLTQNAREFRRRLSVLKRDLETFPLLLTGHPRAPLCFSAMRQAIEEADSLLGDGGVVTEDYADRFAAVAAAARGYAHDLARLFGVPFDETAWDIPGF